MSHNEILDHIQNHNAQDLAEWRFKLITSYEGPLPQNYRNYNG